MQTFIGKKEIMTTIQKRADELKPGDVLPTQPGVCSFPYMVIRNSSKQDPEWVYHYVCAVDKDAPYVFEAKFAADIVCTVEAPTLTPAQQHADELAGLASEFYASMLADNRGASDNCDLPIWAPAKLARTRALLDAIKPPEPPTLAEALASLRILLDCERSGAQLYAEHAKEADSILSRARRTGLLE